MCKVPFFSLRDQWNRCACEGPTYVASMGISRPASVLIFVVLVTILR